MTGFSSLSRPSRPRRKVLLSLSRSSGASSATTTTGPGSALSLKVSPGLKLMTQPRCRGESPPQGLGPPQLGSASYSEDRSHSCSKAPRVLPPSRGGPRGQDNALEPLALSSASSLPTKGTQTPASDGHAWSLSPHPSPAWDLLLMSGLVQNSHPILTPCVPCFTPGPPLCG